jgi:streptogramin lyase
MEEAGTMRCRRFFVAIAGSAAVAAALIAVAVVASTRDQRASAAPSLRGPSPTGRASATDVRAGLGGRAGRPQPRASGDRSSIGSIDEFPIPTPEAAPALITPGPDGNLWFTEFAAQAVSKIGRITPAGTIKEFVLPTAFASPEGIVAGPDGNLWAAEAGGNNIARVTTKGVVTEFPVPTPNAHPAYIAAGADGNLWFTEVDGDQIGKITPSGSIVEFPIPGNGSGVEGIAAGADGAMWFAEEYGNKIGRIAQTGAISEFAVPKASGVNVDPWGIAAGPDSALWFGTVAYNDQVFRISTSGVVSAPIFTPSDDSFSSTVTTGLDGDIWFSEELGKIGRSETSGNGAEDATVPTPASDPWGISAGPDGNIWFSEYGGLYGNKIGRIATAAPNTAYVLQLASGFAPALRQTAAQGDTVQWGFYGPSLATVTDSSGMGLFESGIEHFVSFFSFAFTAAGTYPYKDSITPAHTGKIAVPISVPANGQVGVPFTVTWASATPPPNFVFDVLVKTPGSSVWSKWQTGVTITSADYTPSQTGTYQFRARLRNKPSAHWSGWSPIGKVDVS